MIDPERPSDGDITDCAVVRAGDLTTPTGGSPEAGVRVETVTVVTTVVRKLTIDGNMPSGLVIRKDLEADHPGTGGVETTAEEKQTDATTEKVQGFPIVDFG